MSILSKKWSDLSFSEIVDEIEKYGKAAAVAAGVVYAIGLVIHTSYYNHLHIRSFEILRAKYIFVGFYYILFLALQVFVPVFLLKKWYLRALYLMLFVLILFSFNDVDMAYLQYLIEVKWRGGSYFEFNKAQSSIVIPNAIFLVLGVVFAPLLLVTQIKNEDKEKLASLLLIIVVLPLNWIVFTNDVFPIIPDQFGGGKAAIVKIDFASEVPLTAKIGFDVHMPEKYYPEPQYYGRLIYMDDHSVFLKEANWFSRDVYEFQRDQIKVLRYESSNPREMGMPANPQK
jgi:hypothetical protein